AEQHRQQLLADPTLKTRLTELYLRVPDSSILDVDTALYTGFISNNDRRTCDALLRKSPEQLAEWMLILRTNVCALCTSAIGPETGLKR
ncbi:hypothetical protein VU13_01005, partial [Desulfobulbus sp. US5]|nr:hypothetical protein [Desulfobulbus sp. US5]